MDDLCRFIFDEAPVRGALVQLGDAWRTVCDRRAYPPPVRALTGELLAASGLLMANLKFEGSVILQMRGTGPLKLLVAEATNDYQVRATATWDESTPYGVVAQDLPELLGSGGQFAVMIDQKNSEQPYQGIVPLVGNRVADALSHYLAQSEQVDTCLVLAANDEFAAGLLLQRLPEGHGELALWNEIRSLAHTLSAAELLSLPATQILHRLFHQYDLRVLDEKEVRFGCRCSREKVSQALQMMGKSEVDEILAEEGRVEVDCQFCHTRYAFTDEDVCALFPNTLH